MKIRSVAFLLISSLLTGCVAAVVAAGAAAGLVVYDKRTLAVLNSDSQIYHKLSTTIARNPRFRDSRIIVTSFNEFVLLVGQTPTASLRVVAEKISHGIPNIRRIYNETTVDLPIPLSQRTEDSWITSQIRSLMLTKKGLESGSIRIVTENGIVYLMGIVTKEQANLAVNVARQISGVRKVVKVFQYLN